MTNTCYPVISPSSTGNIAFHFTREDKLLYNSVAVILTLLEVLEIFPIQQLEPLFLPLSSGSWDRKFTLAMVLGSRNLIFYIILL